MSHSLTSANGSYNEKQIVQKRNNSQLFLSTPIFFVVVVVVGGGGGGEGCGWGLLQGWALVKFSSQQDGHLFQVSTNLRLGA